jgi:hypothetical protein
MSTLPPLFTTDFDPLLVTSPVVRSGTTLLQRLLCSSPRALIYGETCGRDLELFLNLYASRALLYTHNRGQLGRSLQRVLAGDVNAWILDLMPEVDAYLRALCQSCLGWLGSCRDCAARTGRPIWGMKVAGWTPSVLGLIRHCLPQSRLLYIHRDILDCLRSAKARQLVRSPGDVQDFCRSWMENLSYVLNLGEGPALLIVKYADLVAEPVRVLERVAAFTGVGDMDLAVLGQRINTQADAGGLGGYYVQPADLTEEERQLAVQTSSPLRERLYPE